MKKLNLLIVEGNTNEENAKLIDPGFQALTPEKKESLCLEVKEVINND